MTTLALVAVLALAAPQQPETISVGSFNIEWFGHGNNARTQEEIETLARFIDSLQVDVLCLQKICNHCPVTLLIRDEDDDDADAGDWGVTGPPPCFDGMPPMPSSNFKRPRNRSTQP